MTLHEFLPQAHGLLKLPHKAPPLARSWQDFLRALALARRHQLFWDQPWSLIVKEQFGAQRTKVYARLGHVALFGSRANQTQPWPDPQQAKASAHHYLKRLGLVPDVVAAGVIADSELLYCKSRVVDAVQDELRIPEHASRVQERQLWLILRREQWLLDLELAVESIAPCPLEHA